MADEVGSSPVHKLGWFARKRGARRYVIPRDGPRFYQATMTKNTKGYVCAILGIVAGVVAVVFALQNGEGNSTQYPCKPGEYLESGRLCLVCAGGRYGTLGNSVNMDCDGPCQAGYYCPDGSDLATKVICPLGSYCPTGTEFKDQYLCPIGFYGSVEGLTTVNCSGRCDPIIKYYCPAGAISANQTSQILCPLGNFCDGTDSAPVPCFGGFYGSELGLSQPTCSGICPAGFYCPNGTTSAKQNVCPKGHYCPEQSTRPTPCASGTYSENEYAISSESCIACPAGKWCPLGSPNASILCPPGFYCLVGTTDPFMFPCSPGYFCPDGSSNPTMVSCPAGSYCPGQTGPGPVPCPPGVYSDQIEQTSNATCSHACPAGSFCPPGTAADQLATYFCPVGYFCPESTGGTIGVVEDEGGTKQVVAQPLDEFRCPGGWRNSRTHSPSIAGCFCNYTAETAQMEIRDCMCPQGHYCLPGSAFDDTLECPFNYYCPLRSTEPLLCATQGYYCPSKSFAPNRYATRVEMSLYSLQRGITDIQNRTADNFMSDLVNWETYFGPRRDQFGRVEENARFWMVENNLPLFAFERGRSQVHVDVVSRGNTIALSTTESERQVWICKVIVKENGAVEAQKVVNVRQLNATTPQDNPVLTINETVFVFPKYFDIFETYAFCMYYKSGTKTRITLSQRFSVVPSDLSIERTLAERIIGSALGFFALVTLLTRFRRYPIKTKNHALERFAYYETEYKPVVNHGKFVRGVICSVSYISIGITEPLFVSLVSFSQASPFSCLDALHTALEGGGYLAVNCIVVAVVFIFALLPQAVDTCRYPGDSKLGRLPTEDLNDEGRFLVVIRHYVIAPLLFEAFYIPILSTLFSPAIGCKYFNAKENRPFEFQEEITWGKTGLQCWVYGVENRHIVLLGLNTLFIPFFFWAALRHIADYKPRLNKNVHPTVPLFDFLFFIAKTFMVLARSFSGFMFSGGVSPAVNLSLCVVLFKFHWLYQSLYGSPTCGLMNNIRSGNLVAGVIVGAFAFKSNVLWSYPDEQCWHITGAVVVGFLCWCIVVWINSFRSEALLKTSKAEYLEWLAKSKDTSTIPAIVTEYGVSTAFTHRVLRIVGALTQEKCAAPSTVATLLHLEQLCFDNPSVNKSSRRSFGRSWSKEKTVNKISPRETDSHDPHVTFMNSVLHHVKVFYFSKHAVCPATASRIFKCIPQFANVTHLDFSQNSLNAGNVEMLLLFLPTNISIRYINVEGNPFCPFDIDPGLYVDVLVKNSVLETFKLCEKFEFTRSFPQLSMFEILQRREKRKKQKIEGVKATVRMSVHRYFQERNPVCKNGWLFQLLYDMLSACSNNCHYLDLTIGGGTLYALEMKNEISRVVDASPEHVLSRILRLKTLYWSHTFTSPSLYVFASNLVCLKSEEDLAILISIVSKMQCVRYINITPEAIDALGKYNFVEALANAITKRKPHDDWDKGGIVIKINTMNLVLPAFALGWPETLELESFSKVVGEFASPEYYTIGPTTTIEERIKAEALNKELGDPSEFRTSVPRLIDSNKTKVIDVTNSSLNDYEAIIIALSLQYIRGLVEFHAEGNQIRCLGIEKIIQAIGLADKTQRTLRKLSFGNWNRGNQIGAGGCAIMGQVLFSGGVPCVMDCATCTKCEAAQPHLTHLDLRNNLIGPKGCTDLLSQYKVNYLKCLELCSNNIGDQGAKAVASLVRSNRSVETMRLTRNQIGAEGAKHLADSLQYNTTLAELYLDWNEFGDEGAINFGSYFENPMSDDEQNNKFISSLKILSVENNMIGDRGAAGIAVGLSSKRCPLDELMIGFNQFGDPGLDAIAKALRTNETLTTISISGGIFGDLGLKLLANALLENKQSAIICVDAKDCPNVEHFGQEALRGLSLTLNSRINDDSKREISDVNFASTKRSKKSKKTRTSLIIDY